MSDLGVAEIPVDEDERPLPPQAAPVKNALLVWPIVQEDIADLDGIRGHISRDDDVALVNQRLH